MLHISWNCYYRATFQERTCHVGLPVTQRSHYLCYEIKKYKGGTHEYSSVDSKFIRWDEHVDLMTYLFV
jgi:hypothetical protein